MTEAPVSGRAVLEKETGAVSEDALRHLEIRSPLNRAIYRAVHDYRMSNMADEDGYPYPLLDLMSNPAPADIGTGEMEMVALVDEIEEAALASLQQPQPVEGEMHPLAKAFEWHVTEQGNLGRVVFSFDKADLPTEGAIRRFVVSISPSDAGDAA
jgi:hypothetical protein